MLRVVHTIAAVGVETGGPATVLSNLTRAQRALGLEVAVHHVTRPTGPMPPFAPGITVHAHAPTTPRILQGGLGYRAGLEADVLQGATVIHNHGLWLTPNAEATAVARALGAPLVVSPHGMLRFAALRRSPVRKLGVFLWRERRTFAQCGCWVANSPDEARALRWLGVRKPVALIENGVELARFEAPAPREALQARWPALGAAGWVAYAGRLHPTKGVDMLLHAWRGIRARHPGLKLLLVGDGEPRDRRALAVLAQRLDLSRDVVFAGHLAGAEYVGALAHAAVAVLPSRSESFGLVVAEALAAGTPVITTRRAPWRVLEDEGFGWWCAASRGAIERALRAALDEPETLRRERGARGRRWVTERLAWERIGERTVAVYEWLLGRGPTPAFVS